MYDWSKKRFNSLKTFLHGIRIQEEDITKIKENICDQFGFDPDASISSEKQRAANKVFCDKMNQQGVSTYIYAGR